MAQAGVLEGLSQHRARGVFGGTGPPEHVVVGRTSKAPPAASPGISPSASVQSGPSSVTSTGSPPLPGDLAGRLRPFAGVDAGEQHEPSGPDQVERQDALAIAREPGVRQPLTGRDDGW